MARTVAIGIQDFENLIQNKYFYIDKTSFISEWWESGDSVTLITRPRRFGKTLNMSMVERFFSVDFAGQGMLFHGLSIWEDEKYRKIQENTGNLPCHQFVICQCERKGLCKYKEKDLSNAQRAIY